MLDWLQGDTLTVPSDRQQQSRSGGIVSAALQMWELHEHPGYRYSVLSMFQHGGICGREQTFRELAISRLPKWRCWGSWTLFEARAS